MREIPAEHFRRAMTDRVRPENAEGVRARIVERRDPARIVETNARPSHDARVLTGGGREAHIMLDGMTYTLRITRQGKLILTK